MTKQHTVGVDRPATVYKQAPGADIDPGWWAVVPPVWFDAGVRDRWMGPYATRAEATRQARAAIRERDTRAEGR